MLSKEAIQKKAEELFPYDPALSNIKNCKIVDQRDKAEAGMNWVNDQYRDLFESVDEFMSADYIPNKGAYERIKTALDKIKQIQ